MPTSVRLDDETQALLDKTAEALKKSKSEVLKVSIREYCERTLSEKSKRPYDLISDLIGIEKSGMGNLAKDSEEILRKAFKKTSMCTGPKTTNLFP